ncbi:transposase [Klebsiella pneumoniae subsp. ozaenae]|uniref:Transposase n=1 Tax=Klebsiella pneumoniae subsp. ozaenae TaxID=574 RepID=A0A378B5M7_KLEPO|nr:transposase [Klebsiella pneumoniae subsp. ozaenae]
MIAVLKVWRVTSETWVDRQVESIKTLSMDMNPAYISAARVHLPNAVEKIAFDHFHVAKMLCAVGG